MQEFLSRPGCAHTALKGDTDLLFVKSLEPGDRATIQVTPHRLSWIAHASFCSYSCLPQAALEFRNPVYRDELVRWLDMEIEKKRLSAADLKVGC